MTHPVRQHKPIAPQPIDDAVIMRDRNHYIIRDYAFDDTAQSPAPVNIVAALMTALTNWRRRYVTRRQLRSLDRHGLADIGIDPATQEREAGKPFWKS